MLAIIIVCSTGYKLYNKYTLYEDTCKEYCLQTEKPYNKVLVMNDGWIRCLCGQENIKTSSLFQILKDGQIIQLLDNESKTTT